MSGLKEQMNVGDAPQREPGTIIIQSDGSAFSMKSEKLSKLEVYAILKVLLERFEQDLNLK